MKRQKTPKPGNAKLATALRERGEALELQAATAEILAAMSKSRGDAQPVFDAIVRNAARLCESEYANVFRYDGRLLHWVAGAGRNAGAQRSIQKAYPMAPDGTRVVGRVILTGRVVRMEDTHKDRRYDRKFAAVVRRRRILGVPLLHGRKPIGVITIGWTEPGPILRRHEQVLKSFAIQAVMAIENVQLFNETKEALERQTATAEILRVIGSSMTDAQPVFEVIVKSAVRLCGARFGRVYRSDRSVVDVVASDGLNTDGRETARQVFPRPVADDTIVGRVLLTKRPLFVHDIEREEGLPPLSRQNLKGFGTRSQVTIPMMYAGEPIGAITVGWEEPDAFDDRQVALLQTFADQAVIAIENVRLFNDTKEALERQTATAEILKVISGSTTDTQPVFEAIVRSAARLFSMSNATIFMRDGDLIRLRAVTGVTVDEAMRRQLGSIYPIAFDPEVSTSARAMAERRTNICVDSEAPDVAEHIRRAGRAGGFRSNTVVPLVRDDEGIGTIVITHPEPGHRLNEKQLALLRTFADQAVIAIENVRLFKELEARNKDLGESLDQQTATAEILKVISSSPTDVQPVLTAIVRSAAGLFDPCNAAILMRDSRGLQLRAIARGEGSEELMKLYPLPFDPEQFPSARAISEQRIVELLDANAAGVSEFLANAARAGKFRSAAFVPLLREGEGVGTIVLTHPQPGFRLTEKQQALMRTFADQAVIAIENVRLFKEIQEKGAQLEVANRHKSEFLANMSHELRTPLNAIIGFSEVLMERMFGEVNEKQADYLKDIHESGKHLLSLINDILDLSKIEAGRMELELGSFHLPTAISNAMTLVRERAQRHGVQLGAEVDDRLGEFQADERKVKQILLNLLSNAVKFTPAGGRVDVSAKLDTDKVEIAVKDTGVGISTEDQAKLFEEFRQVGDAARKAEGTGLGLALTKKFVELHGGAIRVESAPGKGSTFSFSLPLAAVARPASSG